MNATHTRQNGLLFTIGVAFCFAVVLGCYAASDHLVPFFMTRPWVNGIILGLGALGFFLSLLGLSLTSRKGADPTAGESVGLFVRYLLGIMVFVGTLQGAEWLYQIIGSSPGAIALTTSILVLLGSALVQLVSLPFQTSVSHSLFRLAVINSKGEPAGRSQTLLRWMIIWLPLVLPLASIALWLGQTEPAIVSILTLIVLFLWIGAAMAAIIQSSRGLHDRLAGTWVVRR